jgi:hypothetical protein
VVWPLLLSVDDAHVSFEERAAARLERRRLFHTLHAHRLTMRALAAEDAAAASTSGSTIISALPTSLRRDASALSAVSAVVSDTGADVGAEIGLGEMAEVDFAFLYPRACVVDEEQVPSSSTRLTPPRAAFSEASRRICMDVPRTAAPFEEQRLKRVMSGSQTTTTTSSSCVCELQVRVQARLDGLLAHRRGEGECRTDVKGRTSTK